MKYHIISLLIFGIGLIFNTPVAEAQWQTSGSDLYYDSGNVAIGTSNPEGYLLNVDGEAQFKESLIRNYISPDGYTLYENVVTGPELFRHGVLPKQRAKGMVIPMYQYPGFYGDGDGDGTPNQEEEDWWFRQLIDALKRHPEIKPIVIANPNSGPGTAVDGNYTQAIRWLRGAGATVIGYVGTDYTEFDPDGSGMNGLTEQQVKNEIDSWYNLYPEVDGIFFDEVPFDVTSTAGQNALQQYINTTNYLHRNYQGLAIGNPGQQQQNNDYYDNNAFDIVITYEQSTFPSDAALAGAYSYPQTVMENNPHRKAVMVYSQGSTPDSTIRSEIYDKAMYADYFWVWHDSGWGSGDGWNDSYFGDYVSLIAEALNAPGGDLYVLGGGLTVNGTAKTKEVIVSENVGADFVFDDGYDLPALDEVKSHINRYKHLPEIPSADEMIQEGVKVGDLQMKLLQKIEEMTLYMIELKEQNQKQQELINQQKKEIKRIKDRLE